MPTKIIIGSRGSELALWQANFVLASLKKIGIAAEVKIIKTQGDIVQNLSWDKMEGKGFFTKEIEDALLKNEIDLAVHSHKDLPTEEVKGLVIAAVSEREDPSELLLIRKNGVDEKQKFSLKENAMVGTSSARRKSQLLAWRKDLRLEDLRGNVPTRIQKLRDKKYDAILIAFAGVERLKIDLSEFHIEKLDPKEFIPAPAQGVLALQIRENDGELFKQLQVLNDKEVQEVVSVERKVMNLFQGGCQLPLGVFCEKEENKKNEIIFKVRIAKAETWNSFPRYFYFESKIVNGFAESIVGKMVAKVTSPPVPLSFKRRGGRLPEGQTGGEVFISRSEKKNDFFKSCLEANGYKVTCRSLIEIKKIPFKKFPKTDWVFFSSKNSVKHFFEQSPDVNGAKFGAMGKTTAAEIRKYGKRAEFIGSSDDTRLTGKKFASLIGKGTVLFPQAKGSLRSVQLQLRKDQIVDLTVYETVQDHCQLPTADCPLLVFTSPSNAEAFFKKNRVNAGQKVIAMGDATAKALKKHGVKPDKQPASFDDLGLVQAVMSL